MSKEERDRVLAKIVKKLPPQIVKSCKDQGMIISKKEAGVLLSIVISNVIQAEMDYLGTFEGRWFIMELSQAMHE
jgi:hypothetical protein